MVIAGRQLEAVNPFVEFYYLRTWKRLETASFQNSI